MNLLLCLQLHIKGFLKLILTFYVIVARHTHNLIMASFDVKSLFTNIPLQETIDLCVEKLFEDKNYIDGLSKDSFREMLTVTMTESFVLFDSENYKQHDGVAMGSPLGPTFANIFLSS